MRRDYLAAYLAQAPANFQDTTAHEVSKVSKPPFDTFDTDQRVVSPENQRQGDRGFATFDTALKVEYPEIHRSNSGSDRINRTPEISKDTYPKQVSKVAKPSRREERAAPRKPKAWRRAPYYPICEEALHTPDAPLDRTQTDLFYAALALQDGHASDDVVEMLRRASPATSATPNCCAQIVEQAQANPAAYATPERIEKYIAAHPFAWELRLRVSEVQVVAGVQ